MLTSNELESARAVFRVAHHPGLTLHYSPDSLTAIPQWAGGQFTQADVFAWATTLQFATIATAASITVALCILDVARQPPRPRHDQANPRLNPLLCM